MLGSLGKKAKSEIIGLPDEIIYEILVRLPMDPLLNCRAVCKSWDSLIKSPAFNLSHLECTLIRSNNNSNKKKEKEKDDLLIVHAQSKVEDPSSGEFFTLDCDDTINEYTKRRVIPIPNIKPVVSSSIEINLKDFQSIGTCNGLICLVRAQEKFRIPILWNPRVRKVLVLPSPRLLPNVCARNIMYALGYDSHNKDFKLLQIVEPTTFPKEQGVHRFQVFSLRGGSWKDLNTPLDFSPYVYDFTSVEMFGALHWVCSKPLYEINESTVIVTFNLSTELFGRMKIPEALLKKKRRSPKNFYKVRYKGSFALLAQRSRTSDLWVMKEYGVAKSWTKVLTIRMADGLAHSPIYFRESDRILLATFWQGIVSFDRKRKDVKRVVADRLLMTFMDPFLETLVLLDRSDAFSY